MNEQEQLLNELKAKYDDLKSNVNGERLDKSVDLDVQLASKQREYNKLLQEKELIDTKIENTDTIQTQKEWKQITDILDGKA